MNVGIIAKERSFGIEFLMILENEFNVTMAKNIWGKKAGVFMKKWRFVEGNALHFFNSLCEYNKFVLLSYLDDYTSRRGQSAGDMLRY